jgi:predicted transposase/invertase (TIGR01784 family)
MREENGNNNISSPHDKGYKYLLSSKKVFMQFLRSFVKEGWVDNINEGSLVKVDKSYILQDFDKKEADLVYRLQSKEQEIIFYVLLEMQSTVDFQMPYRLLLYMVEIWRDVLKDTAGSEARRKDFRLPSIVPIILYNGDNRWTVPLRYKEVLSGYRMFGDHVLDFEYLLIDINRISEEELLNMANLISSVFLLDKKTDSVNELITRLRMLSRTTSKLTEEERTLFASWVGHILTRNMSRDSVKRVVKIIEEDKEAEIMSANIDRLFQEEFEKREKIGIEKGIEKGVEKGQWTLVKNMLSHGLTIEEISLYTGLSIDEVRRIAGKAE